MFNEGHWDDNVRSNHQKGNKSRWTGTFYRSRKVADVCAFAEKPDGGRICDEVAMLLRAEQFNGCPSFGTQRKFQFHPPDWTLISAYSSFRRSLFQKNIVELIYLKLKIKVSVELSTFLIFIFKYLMNRQGDSCAFEILCRFFLAWRNVGFFQTSVTIVYLFSRPTLTFLQPCHCSAVLRDMPRLTGG